MAPRKTGPARTMPILLCKEDEHILCSCKVCKQAKVAPMALWPYCSTRCAKADKA